MIKLIRFPSTEEFSGMPPVIQVLIIIFVIVLLFVIVNRSIEERR